MIDLRNKYDVNCPRCKGMYLEEAPEEIWTMPGWVIDKKVDGERDSLQIGEFHSLLRGRNRQDFLKGVANAGKFRDHNNLNPSLAAIACKELDGTMFDGELTEVFDQDGELTKGTLKRQSTGEFLGYITWGVLFWKGLDVRATTDQHRFNLANEGIRRLKQWCKQKGLPEPKIKIVERVLAVKENLQKFFDAGYEGAIAKYLFKPIDPNKKTNPYWWKLKADKNRTIDAFIIGVTEGKKGGSGIRCIKPVPSGKAATFTIAMMKDGKVFQVGKMSNLPKDAKQYGIILADSYNYTVVELTASGWNGQELRFPRFVKWREDKDPNDCQFDEQIGKEKKNEAH